MHGDTQFSTREMIAWAPSMTVNTHISHRATDGGGRTPVLLLSVPMTCVGFMLGPGPAGGAPLPEFGWGHDWPSWASVMTRHLFLFLFFI